MRELFSNPQVAAGLEEFGKYTDKEKFKSLSTTE